MERLSRYLVSDQVAEKFKRLSRYLVSDKVAEKSSDQVAT